MYQFRLDRHVSKLKSCVIPEGNHYSEITKIKLKLEKCAELMLQKTSWSIIQEFIGISRSTYYKIEEASG